MWISLSRYTAGPAITALIFRWAEFLGAGVGFGIFVLPGSCLEKLLTYIHTRIFTFSFEKKY